MKNFFEKIWNSPTITTWLSYSTKALSLFIVLPLVLKKFSPGDIVLWYLFFSIISIQGIADFGFRQTFIRLISYAFGGANDIETFGNTKVHGDVLTETSPNTALLNGIVSNMKYIYVWLTAILFVLMVILGTWSMNKPVNESSNISSSWWCWVIVVLVSCVSFYGKIYMNFLEGLYKIAMVRRIETLTSLGAIFSNILVMLLRPTLFNMIVATQFWSLAITLRDWYLCLAVEDKLYLRVSKRLAFDKSLFQKIWRPAWRSGLSGFMSVGLTNLTGVVYAQVGDTGAVAAYLLALRIINQLKEISMAPFYSKIPLLAILRVKNDLIGLRKVVIRSMFFSHMAYVIGFVIIGLFINQFLTLIHSETKFVSRPLWILIGVAFFVHRFGAMHIQVYTSTNHIISHIADGVSGVLFLLASIVLSRYVGVYAIPVGMLVGYLGFYAWYAARYSYKSLAVSFLTFEFETSFIPVLIFLVYIVIIFVI